MGGMHACQVAQMLTRVRLSATSWTVAHWASMSMGFSMQEYWSGLPFPSPGYLTDTGIKPGSPALQADALISEPPGKPPGKYISYLLVRGSPQDASSLRPERGLGYLFSILSFNIILEVSASEICKENK